MRTIVICVFVIVLACTASAQSPRNAPGTKCTLNIAQSPAIRGFKLDMTIEQIKARFPTLNVMKADELGYTPNVTLAASSAPDAEKANFDNVHSVSLNFLDGRVVGIRIEYDGSVKWDNVNQFLPLVTDKYKLDGEWQNSGNRNSQLTCEDFAVNVFAGRNNASLSIYDPSVDRTLELRRKEKEEAARRAFKP